MSEPTDKCVVDECDEPAQGRNKFCSGHMKRRGRIRRGETTLPEDAPLVPRKLTPKEALERAIVRYANADEPDEHRRAKERLRKTLWAYVRSFDARRGRGSQAQCPPRDGD